MINRFPKIKRLLFYLLFISLVLVAAWPLAKVFWEAPRLIGVDTEIFLFYVQDFAKNWKILPPGAWKHFWFEGMPRILDTSWFNFYLIQPLVSWFGAISAVKIFVIFYFFLFLVFSYFLFYKLSKSFLLSLGLTIVSAYSGALLLPAYSAGIILSFASQAWFVATLFFLVSFLESKRLRELLFASITIALGLYTHQGVTTLFTLPAAVIVLLASSNKEKIKSLFIFLVPSGLLASVMIIPNLVARFVDEGHGWLFTTFKAYPETLTMLWEATPKVLIVVFILTLVISPFIIRESKGKSKSLPFWLILTFFLLFELGLYLGKNPLAAFVFPHRIFWLLPVSLGAIISSYWYRQANLDSTKAWIRRSVLLAFCLMLSSVVLWSKEKVFYFHTFPSDNARHFSNLEDYGKIGIEGENLVDLVDSDLYRMYSFSQSYNLLWGMFIPIPAVRGTFHYMTKDNADWFAWMDAAVSQENLKKEGIPKDVAKKQSLWLTDWYAIRYFYSAPGIPGQLADFFWEDFPVEVKSSDGDPVLFRMPESVTSPIISLTDVPTVGFIGTHDAYSLFLRNLGTLNLNSRYLIPIYLGDTPEVVDEGKLSKLDSVFLYDYRLKNKKKYENSWGRLEKFTKEGGIIFMETGSDTPEKWGIAPPSMFPATSLLERGSASGWQVGGLLAERIDFSSLSPLEYEGGAWSFSYVREQDLKNGSRVLLTIGDKMVMVERSIGEGKIIWSGLNLVYRSHYYNNNAFAEIELFRAYLREGLDLEERRSDSLVDRPFSEKAIVKGIGTKGVLFKENNYGGWQATALSEGRKYRLSVLPAGTYFMYSRLPEELQGREIEVVYEYRGKWESWLSFWMSIASFLAVIFIIIKYGNMTIDEIRIHFSGLTIFKRLGRWWESEEN